MSLTLRHLGYLVEVAYGCERRQANPSAQALPAATRADLTARRPPLRFVSYLCERAPAMKFFAVNFLTRSLRSLSCVQLGTAASNSGSWSSGTSGVSLRARTTHSLPVSAATLALRIGRLSRLLSEKG